MILSSWTSPKKLGFQLLLCRLECAEKGTGEKVVLLKKLKCQRYCHGMAHFWKLLFGTLGITTNYHTSSDSGKKPKEPWIGECARVNRMFIVAWRHPCHSTWIWVSLKWNTPKPSDLSSCSPWVSTCWVYFIFRHHFLVWRSDRQSSTSGLLSQRKQAHSPELDTQEKNRRCAWL